MRKTAVNQLSSYRRRWQTVSVKLFFLFFLSECEVTQKVSASRYVYAPYHLPQTARKIIWHTEGTETFQWVSGVTELLLCLRALRIFPAFFHLIWKRPFRIGCRLRQPPCPGEERWLWILRQMTLWGEKAPSLDSPVWLGIQTLCRTSAVTVPLTECHTHYTPSGWFSCWFAYQRVGYKRVFDLTLVNKEFNSMPFDFVAP